MKKSPRFSKYTLKFFFEEFACPCCGYPLSIGDEVVVDNRNDEAACSKACLESLNPVN